jgi:hypothetical protein
MSIRAPAALNIPPDLAFRNESAVPTRWQFEKNVRCAWEVGGSVRARRLSWCIVIAVLAAATSSGEKTFRRTRKPFRSNLRGVLRVQEQTGLKEGQDMNLSWEESAGEDWIAVVMARCAGETKHLISFGRTRCICIVFGGAGRLFERGIGAFSRSRSLLSNTELPCEFR